MICRTLFTFVFVLILVISNFATELHVDKTKTNLVKFVSDAPIEDIEGITDNIDGYLFYSNDDFINDSQLYFEVDLNTLDTGIGLRNRHMRENYLETDKFRMASFDGKLVRIKEIKKNEYEVEAEGKMNIHGVTKLIKVNGILSNSGGNIRITTDFIIKLSDYDIEIPQLMFLKINEEMAMHLDFYLTEAKNLKEN